MVRGAKYHRGSAVTDTIQQNSTYRQQSPPSQLHSSTLVSKAQGKTNHTNGIMHACVNVREEGRSGSYWIMSTFSSGQRSTGVLPVVREALCARNTDPEETIAETPLRRSDSPQVNQAEAENTRIDRYS